MVLRVFLSNFPTNRNQGPVRAQENLHMRRDIIDETKAVVHRTGLEKTREQRRQSLTLYPESRYLRLPRCGRAQRGFGALVPLQAAN